MSKVTHNTNEVVRKVNKQLFMARKNVNRKILTYINQVEITAKNNLIANNSIYQSKLINSFKRVNKLNLKNGGFIRLYVDQPYAPFVEFGTKAKFRADSKLGSYPNKFKGTRGETGNPSKKIIKYLQHRGHNPSEIGGIMMEMFKNGTKPHPYFFPAVFQNKLSLRRNLKNIFRKK
jgi:hypothetical protein